MKKQDWNELSRGDDNNRGRNAVQWDSWRRPYVNIEHVGRFVLFDTGEIVACTAYTNSDGRTQYSKVGITLCNSAEIYETIPSMAKLTTPDGRKVAKAHLMVLADGSTSQQLLAVDKEAGEVYFCGRNTSPLPNVPEEIQKRAQLYWPKHSDRPVSNPIRLVTPRKLDTEQKAKQQEANLMVQAAASLRGATLRMNTPPNDVYAQVPHDVYDTDRPVVDIVQDLSDDALARFKEDGIPTKKTEYVPYLKF